MDASVSIIVTQHCIFWLLMGLLVAWIIVFSWLALRPEHEKKQNEFKESPMHSRAISEKTSPEAPVLQMMAMKPVRTPVGASADHK